MNVSRRAPGEGSPAAMVAAIAVTTGGLLPVFLTAALALQVEHDLGLSSTGVGVTVAVFFAASALCTVGFGRLADRVGGARLMRGAPLLSVASLLAVAGPVRTPLGMVAALAVGGVANGAIQPAANSYLTRTVGAGRLGTAFGVKQAAIPTATLLSGVAIPTVAMSIGWRWAFVIAAGLAAAAALAVRPAPLAPAPARDPEPAPTGSFARPPLLVLAVGVAAGSGAANALGAFFVLSAVHAGLGDSGAGLIAGGASAASAAMRIGLGLRADNRSGGHLRVVALLCGAGAVGLALLAAGAGALVVPAAFIGYGLGWGWAGLLNFAVAHTYAASPGRATGITQMGASAGACLGPLAFGFAVARFGYGPAWGGASAALVVAAGLIMFGRALLRRHLSAGGDASGSGEVSPEMS